MLRRSLLAIAAFAFSVNALAATPAVPAYFEENVGQVDSQVRYFARAPHSALYLTPDEVVLARYSTDGKTYSVSAVRLSFAGASRHAQISGENVQSARVNYLTGREPSKWHTGIPTYARVRYGNLYPGVDAVFYGKEGELEYDLVVAPGADSSKIRFSYEGADAMRIAENGDLVLASSSGEVRQRLPRVYQQGGDGKRVLDAHYEIHPDRTVTYRIANVDPRRELVIDPTLSYSTYIGSGSNDSVNSIAVDQYGRVYATGYTVYGFPTKNPAEGNRLKQDAFVTKFWANGGGLIYSSYLGGDGVDVGNGIAVDSTGAAYITGYTDGAGFPTTAGSFVSPAAGGGDAFVTKLSPSGTSFVYSFLLGGGDYDIAYALALDNQHRAYVTGYTCSNNPSNFPVKNAYQPVSHSQNCSSGGGDVFVTRVNAAGTDLDYSTYFGGSIPSFGPGGSTFTNAKSIAVDPNYSAYITGFTYATDLPTTAGAYQRTFVASPMYISMYVTKFSPDGMSLGYSTFLRGAGGTAGSARAIAVDSTGHAYLTGEADSTLPTTAGAFQPTSADGDDAFVTKFWATGGGLIYSTFLGGNSVESGYSIAVDSSNQAHVTGWTDSSNFPMKSPIQSTATPYQSSVFVTTLSATGGSLLFSTYLGGSYSQVGNSIRLDSAGNMYVGGLTSSTDFPTTPGAYSRTYHGAQSDGFIVKIAP